MNIGALYNEIIKPCVTITYFHTLANTEKSNLLQQDDILPSFISDHSNTQSLADMIPRRASQFTDNIVYDESS